MDADNTPSRRPGSNPALEPNLRQGGTVEPANRATVAKERSQTPLDLPGEHYELRDPFAEVTYRANDFSEMVAKAEQLGSSRFTAIDAQGQRTAVQKVDGLWERDGQRGPQRAVQESSTRTSPKRDEVSGPAPGPNTSKVVPLSAVPKAPARDEAGDRGPAGDVTGNTKALAKIDAQAERAALVARLEAALMERYIIKRAPVTVGDLTVGRTEYRFRGDTSRVAFTESTFRLATDTNSPSVARSMVDVAEARNWKALRVSGNEEFKRMVWLEASVRGVKTLGYEPMSADFELLKKEREARLVNRIDLARGESPGFAAAPVDPGSARGGGGRKAVLAAIEAVLVAKGVTAKRREAVLAAATEKLAQRTRDGQAPKVKVYDKAAPSQRPVVAPALDVQRSRERAAPVR